MNTGTGRYSVGYASGWYAERGPLNGDGSCGDVVAGQSVGGGYERSPMVFLVDERVSRRRPRIEAVRGRYKSRLLGQPGG